MSTRTHSSCFGKSISRGVSKPAVVLLELSKLKASVVVGRNKPIADCLLSSIFADEFISASECREKLRVQVAIRSTSSPFEISQRFVEFAFLSYGVSSLIHCFREAISSRASKPSGFGVPSTVS